MAKASVTSSAKTTGKILPGVSVLSRDELDTPLSFDEAVLEAENFGLSAEDYTVVTNIYEPLGKDKDRLIAQPFFVRSVRFSQDKETGKEFVILMVITYDNKRYLVTDGSTGIFRQISDKVTGRINAGHPTPYNFYLVANGLRKSEFGVTKEGTAVPLGDKTAVSKAATYYFD